jgi:hypothetical protein
MYSNGNFLVPTNVSFLRQGALQIAGLVCSLGMAIVFGGLGGLVTGCFYSEKNKYFYLDTEYFENAHFRDLYKDDKGENHYLKQK